MLNKQVTSNYLYVYRHDTACYTQAHIAAAYHWDPVIQEPTAPTNTGKYINIYIQCMDPSHKAYGHTGGLTHQSNYSVMLYSVCHIITIPANVEPYCDVVLNIVLEVVPEGDA
jgi:hypothetical protein